MITPTNESKPTTDSSVKPYNALRRGKSTRKEESYEVQSFVDQGKSLNEDEIYEDMKAINVHPRFESIALTDDIETRIVIFT